MDQMVEKIEWNRTGREGFVWEEINYRKGVIEIGSRVMQ